MTIQEALTPSVIHSTSPVLLPDVTRGDLARYWAEQGVRRGVEIGTFKGQFAAELCAVNPQLHLTCVDPWIPYDGYKDQRKAMMANLPNVYAQAKARLMPFDCDLWRMTSLAAVQKFPDACLDFVFIDGNHAKEYVLADLKAWTPKVKPGGIISGHDYHHFTKPPYDQIQVMAAVDEWTVEKAIAPWFVFGDGSYCWRKT